MLVFITPDKKFMYDGKRIKELKKEIPEGATIIFAKPMIVYDVEELSIPYLIENYGSLLIGSLKLEELVRRLDWRDFILFVDHNKKTITAYIKGGDTLELPYNALEFLRYVFAKFHSGILLESATFNELEMYSP